jgi:heme/copper-type cytochrome/quinol oxidase subunit 2
MENLDQNEAYREHQEYLRKPLTVGEWFITILIIAIPIVGIVMLFVWAFSANTNVNRANYAKATLLWMVVGIFIALAVLGFMGVAFLGNFIDA